jgi:hypothetical protein
MFGFSATSSFEELDHLLDTTLPGFLYNRKMRRILQTGLSTLVIELLDISNALNAHALIMLVLLPPLFSLPFLPVLAASNNRDLLLQGPRNNCYGWNSSEEPG